jgi:hypothetical protein
MEKNKWKAALTANVCPKPLPLSMANAVLEGLPKVDKIEWPPCPNIRKKDPHEYTAWIAKNKPEYLPVVCRAYSVWRMRRAIKGYIIYTFSTS